jgi:hypothetical protein
MKEADVTHMYLGPTNAGDHRTVKEQMMDYNDDPKGYEQGWTDGWNWAIKRAPFGIQESLAEEYATGKYGDIDNAHQDAFLAFQAAFMLIKDRKQHGDFSK